MAVQGQFGQIIIWNSPKTRQLDVCVLPFSTPFEFLIDVWLRPIPAEMHLTKSVIDDRWGGVRDELVMAALFSVTYGQRCISTTTSSANSWPTITNVQTRRTSFR